MANIIKFKCPHCQVNLNAGSDLAGQKDKCPNCKKDITVPEKDTRSSGEKKKTTKK